MKRDKKGNKEMRNVCRFCQWKKERCNEMQKRSAERCEKV